MKLTSDIAINFIPPGITHHDKIYLIGSCFTEQITNKLQEVGFSVKNNAHGIIYNPVSIRQSLEDLMENKEYTAEHLFFHQGLWHSFRHHGSFSGTDATAVCERINENIIEHRNFLQQAEHIFITFGTSWLYLKKTTSQVVANCHKIPGYEFEKVLMDVQDEINHWLELIQKLKNFSPQITIHFTVSPVKHLRDGYFENNLSKGMLHLLIYNIMQQNKSIRYFPSFEIMQDELRDYRFYDRDLAHPNALAIDYIWEKFKSAYFSIPTQTICDEVLKIRKMMEHRIMHSSKDSENFLIKREIILKEFAEKYPYIRISKKDF